MARKKSKRKRFFEFFKDRIYYIRSFLIVILCAVFCFGIFFGTKYFLFNHHLFDIKKVVVIQVNGSFFNEDERVFKKMYLNKNIFVVDPEQVRILAKKRLSHLKKIEVKRLLPDTLEIEIVSREPVAVLDTSGGIVIDSEGIVLAVGDVPENLPKIKGLSFFFGRPEKGEKIEKSSLDKGLVLIRGLKNKLQKKHMKLIDYVDISDKRNTIIVFGDVVIKMGEDRFSLKIEALKEILADPNVKLKDIGYIDLRFSEAVISVK